MNDLNTVPNTGTFGEAIGKVNTNFLAIKTAIDQLELSVTRSKGFFTSASALSTMYPSPVVGDWAVVQVTENNVTSNIIYKCSTAGTWSNTGTAWNGGTIDLTQYALKTDVDDALSDKKNFSNYYTSNTVIPVGKKVFLSADGATLYNYYVIGDGATVIGSLPLHSMEEMVVEKNLSAVSTLNGKLVGSSGTVITESSTSFHVRIYDISEYHGRVIKVKGHCYKRSSRIWSTFSNNNDYTASANVIKYGLSVNSSATGFRYQYVYIGEDDNFLAVEYYTTNYPVISLMKSIADKVDDMEDEILDIGNRIPEAMSIKDASNGITGILPNGKTIQFEEDGHKYIVIGDGVTAMNSLPVLSYENCVFTQKYSFSSNVKTTNVRYRLTPSTGVIYNYGGSSTRNGVAVFDITSLRGKIIRVKSKYSGSSVGSSAAYSVFKELEDTVLADYDFTDAENVLFVGRSITGTTAYSMFKVPEEAKYVALPYYYDDETKAPTIYVLENQTTRDLNDHLPEITTFKEASDANAIPLAGKFVYFEDAGLKYFVIGDGVTNINALPKYSFDKLSFVTIKSWNDYAFSKNYSRIQSSGVIYQYGSGTNNHVKIFDVSDYAGQIIRVRSRLAGSVGTGYAYSVFKASEGTVDFSYFQNAENVISVGRNITSAGTTYSFLRLPDNAKYLAACGYNGNNGYEATVYKMSSSAESQTQVADNAYTRNKSKEILLNAACRTRRSSENRKDFQIAMITDTHGEIQSIQNVAILTEGFQTIDAMIHLGDWEPSYYMSQSNVGVSYLTNCAKPAFPVIGNHDGGNKASLRATATQAQLYNRYFAAAVEKGDVPDTEGKLYYFKDFASQKVRLIVLNIYDGDDEAFNETYWKPIEYNSSYPKCAAGTSYAVGDKVNATYNDEYSFECVQAVTPSGSPSSSPTGFPAYAYSRGSVCLRRAQLEWLAATLLSTPAGFGVVIASHYVPCPSFSTIACSFSKTPDRTNKGGGLCGTIVADLVEAFRNGTNFSQLVEYTGGASYMESFTLTADFTQKNTGAKFMCYIGGHLHKDYVFKHNTYRQYCITPICGITTYTQQASNGFDIIRSTYDGPAYDCVTVLSANVEDNTITLVKLGVDMTYYGRFRKYMVLNINTGTIYEYGGESAASETDPGDDDSEY